MRQEFDEKTGETWIRLSEEEKVFGLLALCVEALAEAKSTDHKAMLDSLENVDVKENDTELHKVLTATQTGTIVCRLAKELGISNYEAFQRFFRSKTYAEFRTPGSYMSMLGDPAIVQEFINE